jgi:hypothetical protein
MEWTTRTEILKEMTGQPRSLGELWPSGGRERFSRCCKGKKLMILKKRLTDRGHVLVDESDVAGISESATTHDNLSPLE